MSFSSSLRQPKRPRSYWIWVHILLFQTYWRPVPFYMWSCFQRLFSNKLDTYLRHDSWHLYKTATSPSFSQTLQHSRSNFSLILYYISSITSVLMGVCWRVHPSTSISGLQIMWSTVLYYLYHDLSLLSSVVISLPDTEAYVYLSSTWYLYTDLYLVAPHLGNRT